MPDGTKGQPGATPGADKSGTPQTITREEHEKALRDATSAILADVGRQKKATDDAMKTATAAQARLDKMLKEQTDAELEAARDNPEQLSGIRERQRRREMESQLEEARQELTDKTAKLTQYESRDAETARETKAVEIATRLNVDAARLIKMSKYTDGTPEAIEDLAKELPKKDGKPGGLRPDSSASIGGGSTWEQVRAAYIKDPRDPIVKEQYLEMKAKRGR